MYSCSAVMGPCEREGSAGEGGWSNSEKRREIQECEESWKQVDESPLISQRSA